MTGTADQEQSGTAAEGQHVRTILDLAFAQMRTHLLGTAARLGIFDLLGDGERTAAGLAEALGIPPGPAHRLLRALAGERLLVETEPGTFRSTPAGALLRSGVPGSMLAVATTFTDPVMMRGWEHLEESLRTGRPSFDTVFGTDFFGYLTTRPELSAEFNAAMGQATRAAADIIPHHYAFGRFACVVDVGGGDGTLLSAILRAHPGLRGIVHDTAEGLAQAAARFAADGLADRATTVTGDFFASVPPGGDLYLLKSVLHDWDDAQCATILGNVRKAVPDDGALLIVEPVLPPAVPAGDPGLAYLSDLNMLVNLGGRERTEDDFAALCATAGFRLETVHPLPHPHPFRLIEARPA
ncbi:methyltransferase [Streptomyces mashuensis]|uniref:Methyltransferase n=1 Tax=Streptomyces mashuensis TaxID=33904 RepID=A0A919B4Y3_9ACTN|nr:methyltransferase [Streptomyces mashuensis]GHF55019.1 methyltransferase [Streptomyces mashuensis]